VVFAMTKCFTHTSTANNFNFFDKVASPYASRLALNPMPESGFREHLNQLNNTRQLRVVQVKGATLFVDSQFNIRAAIIAASFAETVGTESFCCRNAQYLFATDNTFSKVSTSVRTRLFIESARSATGKMLKRPLQKIAGVLVSCGKHLRHMQQEKNLSSIKAGNLTGNTQWHTVRLTS